MFPCRMIGGELRFVLVVYSHILPVEQRPVFPHRTDFDTDPARRDVSLVQRLGSCSAGFFIGQAFGIIAAAKGAYRTRLHTFLALDA